MQDIIEIACTPDDNYAQHCVAMLNSLFTNNSTRAFQIHVIINGLNQKNQKIIADFILKHKHSYKFYTIDASSLSSAPVYFYVSIASYYRFLLPSVIDKNIDKLLYLDSDLIVRTDITPLWNTDIDNYYVGAVKEIISQEYLQKMGIKPGSPYFNAGILLINLKKWRDEDIMEKSIAFTKEHPEKIIYWDQDVLNNLFQNAWKQLDLRWNVTHYYYKAECGAAYFGLPEEVYNDIKLSPGILHFAGPHKPWIYNTEHPLKQEYYKYLKGTPWASFKYIEGPGVVQRIKTATKKSVSSLFGKSTAENLIAWLRKSRGGTQSS